MSVRAHVCFSSFHTDLLPSFLLAVKLVCKCIFGAVCVALGFIYGTNTELCHHRRKHTLHVLVSNTVCDEIKPGPLPSVFADFCVSACSWTTCFLTVVIGAVGVYAKADMNPHVWGEQEALKQLKEEGVI